MIQLPTRIFPAYEAGLAVCRSALPDDFTIYDGPQAGIPTDRNLLMYGAQDITSTTPITSVDSGDQSWHDVGASTRQETFAIYAVLQAASGSARGLPDCRARTAQYLALIEAALRLPVNVTLGNALGATGWCGLSVTRLVQLQNTKGCATQTQFVIASTALI